MKTRPCWIEIRTRALSDNFHFLKSLAPADAELLVILKSDAYGHSLEICAPALAAAGAKWMAVTSLEEGITARALCSGVRVMVIGGVVPGQGTELVKHDLTAVVWEPAQLDDLAAAARAAGLGPASLQVHVEIDTGMSRQGASVEGLGAVLGHFAPDSPLRLEGVMTHLYAADESNGVATHAQMERLQQALAQVEAAGLYPDWLNVGNSAALLSGTNQDIVALASRHGMKAMIRPGLALYGLAPRFEPADEAQPEKVTASSAHLEPVLTWKSEVIGLRDINPGDVVGYNGTFVATEPLRLALLTVGYADGLFRNLGNRFSLLVRGQRAPIVGRVSMDHTVIDVTEISDVVEGDEVVIIGSQGNETLTAYDHADAAGTIPWEVVTRISSRIQRVAV
jgi:alanine racemase